MPRALFALWCVMAATLAAWGAREAFGIGGSGADDFFHPWVNDVVLWGAAAVTLSGALNARRGRTAWILVAAGLAAWALGDTIWSLRFEQSEVPITSISDGFWLAWYPLIVVALALLVRDRVPRFELHRWIDGIIVMLIIATAWEALFFRPVVERSAATAAANAIEFIYVLGDLIIVGAVLGVLALMAWRPGRMWLLLGAGVALLAVTDAVYCIDVLGHRYQPGGAFNIAAAAGALLIAYAAWEPHPGRLEPRPVYGWAAIALPLTAQALAISIQVYAYFNELPASERVFTVAVLLIAMVQIVVARPRASSTG
jgi:hypothetical protein